MNGIVRYFQESRQELSRVTWPNRQQVLEGTQVVLFFIIAMSLLIFIYDSAFAFLIRSVVPR
ncbi:preprotein translocase subunit SecE [Deinococcus yavapaiensis]|uniref:Protein translocase subunit SecE n=1 Tax=Deinococcus yavapaiensis KR-236 TaxID=694435 RepID=A0A318SJA3_9DEIO|nr:preprotein translocase subunit SecE [Deinococcus yavapaiensis]PYE54366.1 protein translocase subunit secE/sec61 gamma [Deinococcus yavapaiensis KR-236]